MKDLTTQIKNLILTIDDLDFIVIEEINRGISRIGQKTLDGAHWILMNELEQYNLIGKVKYRDSDGTTGWRTRLGLVLTENDKRLNAERRKINKKKKKGTPDLILINKKHLACRYVNSKLGLNFDVDLNPTDNDVVDALGLALSEFLTLP